MSTGILVLAALVVIILATVALVLWRKVWVQQADNVLKLKDLADKKEAHQAYLKFRVDGGIMDFMGPRLEGEFKFNYFWL